MYKVIIGKMVHTPGKVREYRDTHVKTGFESWWEANDWRINHPLFHEDDMYLIITKDTDGK